MSPAPVLIVHPSSQVAILAGGADRFRHVLAPTDFSREAQRGVDVAIDLALELTAAALTVVHVFDVPFLAGQSPGDVAAEAEASARRKLDRLVLTVPARRATAEDLLGRDLPESGVPI
jgi:nucleotide-binding universal stress UspA family protein